MITALDGDEGSASRPGRSLPREIPGTPCTGCWVGPRAGLDRCRKSRPHQGFDSRTVQPIASRYTDYATRRARAHARTHAHSTHIDMYIIGQVNFSSVYNLSWRPRWRAEIQLYSLFNFGVRMVQEPAALATGKKPGVYCTGDWVGHRAGPGG